MDLSEFLKDGEVLEEVEGGIKIIADPKLYRYTSDSIRLAKCVSTGAGSRILDLCSGSGIIPLALASYTSACIDAVEIQYPLYDMAARSVRLNALENRIKVFNADLVGFKSEREYDAVTCNPPYYKLNTGDMRKSKTADAARHELYCTLRDIAETAEKSLKFGGRFYMVHKCERLSEVLCELSSKGLEPKELKIFRHGAKNCDTFVVTAKKGAKSGMTVNCLEL